jgi:hypothetical protein
MKMKVGKINTAAVMSGALGLIVGTIGISLLRKNFPNLF